MATVANPIYDAVRQLITLDDEMYKDDDEMMRIVHRLLSAASDAELRQTMNVEDEYYSAIENRDTAIMLRDEKIAEQSHQLAEKDEQLSQKDEQLSQKDEQLSQQKEQLNAMLETSVRLLLQNNVPADVIAANYNIPEQVVLDIAESLS